jgi:hypothetical protein
VQYQVGSLAPTNMHFLNIGTTCWLNEWIAVGARFAAWVVSQPSTHDEGEMSGLATLRMEL